MNILILRRFNFSGDYRSFITRQSIRSVLARCLFKKILLILLIFFICKNRENMRNLITLKQESSQFKINLKCANNDTDFNFFLRNIPEVIGVSSADSSIRNLYFVPLQLLHKYIVFLRFFAWWHMLSIFDYVHRNLEVFIFYFMPSFLYMQKQRCFNAITLC